MAGVETLLTWLDARVPRSAHLCLDSRRVGRGDVFVACPGISGDGRDHIAQAVANGAVAVLREAQGRDDCEAGVPSLSVAGLRAQLGDLADQWYGRPSESVKVIAVTGTNGKTSCTQWIAAALNRQDRPCGLIGTLGTVMPDGTAAPGVLTTPDVLTVHRTLAAMRDAGAELVAMEASSIGLEQGRLDGVRIALAGWTNLSRDHLDYHGTMEKYEQAKRALFRSPTLLAAVVNADDAAGRRLIASLPADRVIAYGEGAAEADAADMLSARDVQDGAHGMVFTLHAQEGDMQVVSRLVGSHNIANLLLVGGVLRALGNTLDTIAAALSAAQPVPGRLEPVLPIAAGNGAGPMVVVDYAHTPDALGRVLAALRPAARARGGRLVCLFGCGGDRDAGKRPEMGRVAAELADAIVITSDNPRGEAPEAIIDAIAAGVPDGAVRKVIVDRAHAILRTLWDSDAGDVVLLAGKGHETYQETAGIRLPFDDRQWARLGLSWPAHPICTDSRKLGEGELFLALRGENFDGHDYVPQAHAAGAHAALVERPVPAAQIAQIALGDTRAALGKLAGAWRAQHALPVIAVTGSNGKTTTKEMISAILAAWAGEEHRLATAGNLNNEIGVPLTLLRLSDQHRAAVIELGMNHPGEIAVLAGIAAPTVALVNNAQREHQEFMHTVEAVARENGAVLAALPADGVAVYPGDDAHAYVWDALAQGRRTIRFGLRADLDVHARDVVVGEDGIDCELVTPAGCVALHLNVHGMHNLRNALAAVACALAGGIPLPTAAAALGGFSPVKGRMQHRRLADGSVLIDDSYNANPDSVRAAIDVLANLPAPRALVLGDMGEVGENGPAMHAEVGAYARERGIDLLFTLGDACRDAVAAYGAGALAADSVEQIVDALRAARPASILVKGSRFMRMERVVSGYLDNKNTQEDFHAA